MKFQYGTYNNYKARLIVYADICKKMLSDIGIETGNVVSCDIEMNPKQWGLTTMYANNTYNISINYMLIDLSYMNEFIKKDKRKNPGLLNTVIHELLHTYENSMNHGKEWKKNAKKVYEKYGIEIKEKDSYIRKGFPKDLYITYFRYVLQCKKCGTFFGFNKIEDIPDLEDHCCSFCEGELIRIR